MVPAMADDERRVHPRYDLLAQISVRHGNLDHVLEIVNLSRGGALVDLGGEPRPRWLVLHRDVDVRLFDAEGRTVFERRGKIVRIAETLEHRTFAVQFEDLLDDAIVRGALAAAGRPPPLPTAG
jgi:hypothetical protein